MKLKKAVSLILVTALIAVATISMSSCGFIFNAILDDNDESNSDEKNNGLLDFDYGENKESDELNNESNSNNDSSAENENQEETYEVIPSTEGLAFELNSDGESYTLVGIGDCESTEIVISHYNDKPVTAIASRALEGCSSITDLTVYPVVKSIARHAFYKCTRITNLTIPYIGGSKNPVVTSWDTQFCDRFWYIFGGIDCIPECLSTITVLSGELPTGAFSGLDTVTSITLHNNITNVSVSAFNGCSKLKSISLPDNVNIISDYAFKDCKELTSINIPNSVTAIGREAFAGCNKLENVSIGNGVTEIYYRAFAGCGSLTNIIMSDNVKYIGEKAFIDTGYYNTESNWENGVLYLGKHLIRAKEDISGEYTVKAGTLHIAPYAFYDCANLNSIIIPNGVLSIGSAAFSCSYYKSNLKSITIPETVTNIGSGAFDNCKALETVNFAGSISQWNKLDTTSIIATATINYNYGK